MPRTSAAMVDSVQAQSQGFMGGVNVRDAVNQLQPDEARTIENMVLDERGGATKRTGCTSQGTFGAGTDRAISLYTFYRGSGVPQVLMHTSGGTLYYTVDPTANPVVWTQIATGLSTTVRMSFETFNSKCYFGNGVDAFASWDGTTYTAYPSAPKGRYLRLYKDAMWISGVTGLPDRVYSSAPGDPETWPVATWVDIAKGDGDLMTALATDGLYLITFKRNRTFIIFDAATMSNRVIDYEKGCEGHFTLVQFETAIYFLSRHGFCEYLGDSPSRFISYKLDPMFDPNIINLNALATSWAYSTGTRIGWAIPEAGQTRPSILVEYYPRLGQISQYTLTRGLGPFAFMRIPAGVFTLYRSGTVEFLYGGHNTANKLLWIYSSSGTDDGVPFQGLLETGAYDFGNADLTTYIHRLRVLGRGKFTVQIKRNFETGVNKSYSVDLSASIDTWNPTDLWGVGSWGPDSNLKERIVNTDVYGRKFTFRFLDAETTVTTKPLSMGSLDFYLTIGEWSLFGILFDAKMLGVRP